MSTTPLVSVIVRAFNEENYIGQLMYGISQQDLTDYEVILVDSGSTDRTVAIAKAHGARIVNIEKSDFSFGRSLNMGCSAALGTYIVVVSAHVYPRSKTWLRLLVEPLKQEKVAVSYGMQRGDDRSKFSELLLFQQWFPESGGGAQHHYFCNNANAAVRKSDWETCPYDERLTGLEDLKYAKHFFELGREVHYCPDALIIHVHEETWPRVRNRYMREAIALKQIDPQIPFGFAKFMHLLIQHVMSDFLNAARQRSLFKRCAEIVMFRFNQIWGTYQGYKRNLAVTEEMRKRFYYPSRSDCTVSIEENSDAQIMYSRNWSAKTNED